MTMGQDLNRQYKTRVRGEIKKEFIFIKETSVSLPEIMKVVNLINAK
jgi:hypothetical protein